MTDTITLTGIVATVPRALRTTAGLNITSFRLASAQRRFDRGKNAWVDTETNWYTVTAFRGLAENAAASVAKGDRVVVTGRLRVRAWENEDRSGTTVEVDADAIGHDLHWCTTRATRVAPAGGATASPAEPTDDAPDGSADESPDGDAPAVDSVPTAEGGGAVPQTSFEHHDASAPTWGDEEAREPF